MKIRKSIMILVFIVSSQNFLVAQTPESFFPSQVGNLWQYSRPSGSTTLEDWSILQDSLDTDGYKYLYVRIPRTGEQYWAYRLDSANVYEGGFGFWGFRPYWLAADSGEAWVRYNNGNTNFYGWVAAVQQGVVFGRLTTIKIIRLGPNHPDSCDACFYYHERHLASGFGVIYAWEEPGYVAFLRGCVIAGDTFGTVVSVESDKKGLPTEIYLNQNYPNPFNPTTTLEFALPTESSVRLTVYDVLGRELAILVDERRKAGNYKISFDGSKLPSGIYIAKLQAGERIITKRMTLIK